ncbi:MAG: TIM-barrel domain-containing protein, partial [Candidatus Hermodarchaeota archaeon]
INDEGFIKWSLSIELTKFGTVWHYGDIDNQNLKGTTRTLDRADGKIPLEDGLISRAGWSIIDDSTSLVFNDDGWLEERAEDSINYKDLYFFGFGNDYEQCLKDYCKLAGPVPLLPRWALGNWWSRYWHYTQEELTDLMNEFEEKEIPLSVCIIDMDWHIVKIEEYLKKHSNEDWSDVEFHSGWTGFTWNKDLFPDYKGFLKFLHQKGLNSALNLHPALGIFPHEEQYKKIAEFMGIDPESRKPVKFDIADPKFAEAYFKFILHPYEEDLVDFWWMDWQQEKTTKIKGLDPLWWLNHLHFYDLGRNSKKRPFIFSRYGGLGNHRYQIGFSGDTFTTWDSLAFLPYFTSTASNVAYSWWSHDLGGHMGGYTDSELYIRWVQFGLFSPIFRLHSTNNPYLERLPWGFDNEVYRISKNVMQLRHAFIPYLYTMSWRNYIKSIPLMRPMYYLHPNEEVAYQTPNQYYFGSELLVSPFISKINEDIGQSRQELWLPRGDWFNFFTGEYYKGGQTYPIYGRLDEIPVFAKAGAIIPLAHISKKDKWNETNNPKEMDIVIFPGSDNIFELYEDDGNSQDYLNGKYVVTEFSQTWEGNTLHFRVKKLNNEENINLIPKERTFTLIFKGIKKPDSIEVQVNGNPINFQSEYDKSNETLYIKNVIIIPINEINILLATNSKSLMSKQDRTFEKCKKMLKLMKTQVGVKRILDSKLLDVIQAITKVNDILSSFITNLPPESTYERRHIEFLKKMIPTIQEAIILESIIINKDTDTLKDNFMDLENIEPQNLRMFFQRIIRRSLNLKELFSLKENQIKAFTEICSFKQA